MNLKKPGFTLLEMIVSMAVIMMVTVLFIANYKSANKRTDLTMAAQNLAADLHAAQNNTLGLVKYNGEVPAGGWGINLDRAGANSNHYTLFADLNPPAAPEDETGYMIYDPGTEGNQSYGARVTALPNGITISGLMASSCAGNPSQSQRLVNVSFLPPDPQTNIYCPDSYSTSTALEIKLTETSTGKIKTVRVNFLGLVEVLD